MSSQPSQPNTNALARIAKEKSEELVAKLPMFGHIIWLYMQSSQHKHLFIQDLESRVLPGVLIDQCKLYLKSGSGNLPIGFVSWAYLSEEVEQRYIATQRIAPSDWSSGDRLWLIDMVTPFGGSRDVILDLNQKIHVNKTVSLFYPDENGRVVKSSLDAVAKHTLHP